MRFIEHDGKQILRRAGLPVPGDVRLLASGDRLVLDRPAVMKAQLLEGGRGKVGLVRVVGPSEGGPILQELRGRLAERPEPPLVMVEDQIAFDQECYVGWRIDDLHQAPVLMFSPAGGVEIEAHPDTVRQLRVDPLRPVLPHHLVRFLHEAGAPARSLGPLARFAADLYGVFRQQDADLLEINPLALTVAGVVALDCKLSTDENALWRHAEWRESASFALRHSGMTELEARAEQAGVTFIEMPGTIALLSSGAGLGMALVDLLATSGLSAGCFCDTAGGSGESAFRQLADLAFDRAESPEIDALAAYFTLSATSLKPAVTTLKDVIQRRRLTKPIVIGLAATGPAEREMTLAEAREEFGRLGYPCVEDPAELVAALEDAIGKGLCRQD